MNKLGSVIIIANPAAQSGAAAKIAKHVARTVLSKSGDSEFNLILTEYPGHAVELVKSMPAPYDTLIAIGGDGMMHEVANGLMAIPKEARPNLAVVPVGSGNDYAKTLGMSKSPDKAIKQIFANNVQKFDVGKVNDEYFVETLSFGLDAAIAIDTMERRKKKGNHGAKLYFESGVNQIKNHFEAQEFSAVLTAQCKEEASGFEEIYLDEKSYVFAVQIGKTYGGGFNICPKANPQDGLFDVCIAKAPLSPLKALGLFMLAKNGNHESLKPFEFYKCRSLKVDFTSMPPAQADGEIVKNTTFDINILPRELSVLVGDYNQPNTN